MTGLFGYLPLAITLFLPIYWWLRPEMRGWALGLFSGLVIVSLGLAFAAYVLGASFLLSWMSRQRRASEHRIAIGFALAAITIFAWKYLVDALQAIGFFSPEHRFLVATIGVSYMGLRIADVYFTILRRRLEDASPPEVFRYLAFFPLLPAGPLARYSQFAEQSRPETTPADFVQALARIGLGLFKKAVFVDLFIPQAFGGLIAAVVSPEGDMATLTRVDVFVAGVVLFLRAYIDISAYTDIAIGTARLFGIKAPEDLNFPLIKRNISEFWRSWHITVVSWCRDNIYVPSYVAGQNIYLSAILTFVVMGLWHNVEFKWLLWGLYQGLGLSLFLLLSSRSAFQQMTERANALTAKLFSYAATFLWGSGAFLIMGPETAARSFAVIRALFLGSA